jgi:hypothetical protein
MLRGRNSCHSIGLGLARGTAPTEHELFQVDTVLRVKREEEEN